MLYPVKGKYVCEVLKRPLKIGSIYLPDKNEKDNCARDIHTGNILHYKLANGKYFTYEGKKMVSLREDELIAIEDDGGKLKALGSMVICEVNYEEKIGSIFIPDGAKQNSGEFSGKVVAVGEKFMDKDLTPGNEIIYLRNEGYVFRKFYGNDRERFVSIKECWVYGKRDKCI